MQFVQALPSAYKFAVFKKLSNIGTVDVSRSQTTAQAAKGAYTWSVTFVSNLGDGVTALFRRMRPRGGARWQGAVPRGVWRGATFPNLAPPAHAPSMVQRSISMENRWPRSMTSKRTASSRGVYPAIEKRKHHRRWSDRQPRAFSPSFRHGSLRGHGGCCSGRGGEGC